LLWEVKNLDSPKPKKITGKVSTEDIKVIAATSNEAEKLASKFYNEILSIVGLKDGFINHVEAGQSLAHEYNLLLDN
jgi:rubrerythrin